MKRVMIFLLSGSLSFGRLFSPEIVEAWGGHGGRGGFHGGFGGRGFHSGFRGGPFHHGGRFFGFAPFFGFGAGFLAGYWLNGYYYTYPYSGGCQRWIPTGSYHTESRQDPNTRVWYAVQVPDGYWEAVPCY